jgi:hypothetical protein
MAAFRSHQATTYDVKGIVMISHGFIPRIGQINEKTGHCDSHSHVGAVP